MSRISLFGIFIDALTKREAVERIVSRIDDGEQCCDYVVTPNVDHIVKLSESISFRNAYLDAFLVLADGRPVVAASRLLGGPLPEVVPGSDLVPLILKRYSDSTDLPTLRIYLLGAAEGVAAEAKLKIEQRFSNVLVCGFESPPIGFDNDDMLCRKICERINASAGQLLVLGLGAPKQELWVAKYKKYLKVDVALCVGATIDFLAEKKTRAPKWVQIIAMEWLHRLLSEPRRLAQRYAKDAVIFPILFLGELRKKYFSRL